MRNNPPIPLACLLLTLTTCQVSFVSAYDQTFDTEITSTQKDVDALMLKIAATPTAPYPTLAPDDTKIQTDFDALDIRAAIHTNDNDTINSLARLKHTFAEFQSEQATPQIPPSPTHVRDELAILNHEFQILMAQELAKKTTKE
jgi:hypothetical protein